MGRRGRPSVAADTENRPLVGWHRTSPEDKEDDPAAVPGSV